jgi:hypothetical protein
MIYRNFLLDNGSTNGLRKQLDHYGLVLIYFAVYFNTSATSARVLEELQSLAAKKNGSASVLDGRSCHKLRLSR